MHKTSALPTRLEAGLRIYFSSNVGMPYLTFILLLGFMV